jgi:hypothetical protein
MLQCKLVLGVLVILCSSLFFTIIKQLKQSMLYKVKICDLTRKCGGSGFVLQQKGRNVVQDSIINPFRNIHQPHFLFIFNLETRISSKFPYPFLTKRGNVRFRRTLKLILLVFSNKFQKKCITLMLIAKKDFFNKVTIVII